MTELAGRINAPAEFPRALISRIEDDAARQREAMGRSANRERAHFAALADLVQRLSRLDARDPRIVALADISGERRRVHRLQGKKVEAVELTSEQKRVLAVVADSWNPAPKTEDFLAELIAVGIRDLTQGRHEVREASRKRIGELERELADTRAQLERTAANLAEARASEDELSIVREENAELRQQIETLRESFGGEDAPSANKPRRTKVEDAGPGIYTNAAGNLEVLWTENGKNKYFAMPAGATIEEARRKRAEATGQPLEGTEPPNLEAVFDAVQAELGHELSDEEIAAAEQAVDDAADGETVEELAARIAKSLKGGATKATAESTSSKGR